MSVVPATTQRRVAVFDGLRGIAIVLVVFSHTWVIATPPRSTALRVLFTSGNFAVSIFFVVGGFLATRGMLRQVDEQGVLRPGVAFVRRWIRLSSQVYPLVVAVLALTAIDTNMATYKLNDTRESAWRIVTYTWNGYVRTHTLDARPDLGHLWYVCTDLWVVGLILALVYLLGRRRLGLLTALVALVALVMIYRHHVYVTEGVFSALIRVQTRADGLLWGAMAAVAIPWLRRFQGFAPAVGVASVLALIPLAGLMPAGHEERYFGLGGWILNLALALFVVSVEIEGPNKYLAAVLGARPLAALGRYSLVVYVWHFPIFWYLSRNTLDWSMGWRVVVGYGVTIVVATTAQVIIETPVQRWLASDFWAPFDAGLLSGARRHLAARYRRDGGLLAKFAAARALRAASATRESTRTSK